MYDSLSFWFDVTKELIHLIWSFFVGKFLAGRSTYEFESPSFMVSATEKVLVPGSQSDASSSTEQLEALGAETEDSKVC